jgi:hypothetical protein
MSNNSKGINPWFIDSTGHLIGPNTQFQISGIVVLPKVSEWEVKIQDGAGNLKFFANNGGASISMPPCVPFISTGLNVSEIAGCEVLIYTTP